jgi:DNA-3-methyladenine glycosylase I
LRKLKQDKKQPKRCEWSLSDPLYIEYHDTEWGDPVHDDTHFFEMITLEGAQAGLSWITILKRREGYRKAFKNFDPLKVSKYTAKKVETLLKDTGIIRNRLKVISTINNAKAFIKIQDEFGSFDKYIWQFTNGSPIINKRKSLKNIPATTKESDAMSKDLKKRGFSFVGTTICYAFMQATGMVNDHTLDCFRYNELKVES